MRRVPVRSSAAAAAAPIQKRAEPHATSDSGGGTSPRDARLLGKLQEAMLLLGAEGTSEATDGGGDTDSERTARIQAKLQLAMSLMGGSDLGEESESAAASVAGCIILRYSVPATAADGRVVSFTPTTGVSHLHSTLFHSAPPTSRLTVQNHTTVYVYLPQ